MKVRERNKDREKEDGRSHYVIHGERIEIRSTYDRLEKYHRRHELRG